mgnify:CR=1 FL=1
MELIGKKLAVTAAVLMAVGQLIGTGLKQYQDGQYEEAAKTFTTVITRYEDNPYTDDAYYWRARSLRRLYAIAERYEEQLPGRVLFIFRESKGNRNERDV